MKRNWIGFPISLPTFDAPGDGGGGGGDTGGGGGGDFSGSSPTPEAATPDIPEVDDSYQFRIKGQDKPISLGDYRARFQSQATKAQQEAARYREKVAQYERERTQAEQQRQIQARQNAGQQGNDFLGELRQMPYLDGNAAAQLFERFSGEIQQRDRVHVAALQEIQRLRQVVGTLNESHSSQAFEGKISRMLQDGGYPQDPRVQKLAQALYLAYEGENLDAEFPEIWKQYWEDTQAVLRAENDRKVREARKPSFIPGRGGVGSPSKPVQLDPRLTAQQVADELFPMFSDENT